MAIYQYYTEQFFHATTEEIWDFISSPKNLKRITPEYMGFDIISKFLPEKMYQGMIINYKVSPVLHIKLDWVTEITHVEDNKFFVDEQRVGPYKMWHHEHHIKNVNGGVLMTDILSYKLPYGFFGDIAHRMFVKSKIQEIFEYRRKALEAIFGK
jgi:ligand-binding SRPBCC domain-containing protein